MKLASLKDTHPDGRLVVVSEDLHRYITAEETGLLGGVSTLQQAIEDWQQVAPILQSVYVELNAYESDRVRTKSADFNQALCASPLPRAYQWLDGSAYLCHVERVRKARGAEMPPSFLTDPLMYQGGSDYFLGPQDPIPVENSDWGIDFEAEVAIITNGVPMGTTATDAAEHIIMVMLVNDVSLRNLIPNELAKGFGFLHGKPPTAFSPVVVTPDELKDAWVDSKVHLPLITHFNGNLFGEPQAGEDMQFGFDQLIAHAAKTRPLSAGTIIGSGTVSNKDISKGSSCLVEKRVLEIIATGAATTPFMQFGDRIQIEMLDARAHSIFGTIKQDVRSCQG